MKIFTYSLLAGALIVAGCQSNEHRTMPISSEAELDIQSKPMVLQDLYRKLLQEGDRNRVLNLNRIGLAAMEFGHNDLAKEALDEALLHIDSYYGSSESAKQARSNFSPEDTKRFLGEPYERAMSFYYRGLLYLMDGDYQNARASFKSAQIQDTMSRDEVYQGDFALLHYLDGWSSHCNGDTVLARESFERAAALRPGLQQPKLKDDLLVIAEIGSAPVKSAAGEHNQLLQFAPSTESVPDRVVVSWQQSDLELIEAEDIAFQATTRGGREIDSINEGKAEFKDGMDATGTMLADTGLALAMSSTSMYGFDSNMSQNMAMAGGAAALFGLGAQLLASATRPEADLRTWEMLPHKVVLNTASGDSSISSLDLTFFDTAGESTLKVNAPVHNPDIQCRLAWATDGVSS